MAIADLRAPPHVLIIHDHHSVTVLVEYLRAHGFGVTHWPNDGSMLAVVIAIHPDLIVLDFAVDGGTAETLRGDVRTRHIPLIGLTDLCRLVPEQLH